MTAFVSQGELTRDALTDAPDGAWIDTFLEHYNGTRRNITSVLQKGISTSDNTINAEKTLVLVHNVEIAVSNPLKVPVAGIIPLQCDGLELDSMGKPTSSVYQLDPPNISWRPNPLSSDGGVLVKAFYRPNGDTYQLLSMRNSAAQVVPTGDNVVEYNTADVTVGSYLSYSSGVFTADEEGTYQVNVSYHYDGDGAIYNDVRTGIVASGQSYWSIGFGGSPASLRVYQNFAHALYLSAGGTFSIYTNHGAAGNRTIGNTAGDSRFQSRCTVAKLSVPPMDGFAGRIKLMFYGG